ncbi:MAG: acetoacetate--CoA ligase [Betaproteobacteria bacterium RIFCSPLOWO2_02_FULL_67_19]|nr:MAG: acetoacetate--CoA ligase [Betaproteobacteria bacterium RIFCSPLOWO2_02_FULL_67_19]
MQPSPTDPIWQPSAEAIAQAQMTQFMRHCARRYRVDLDSYADFHRWSVDQPAEFWGEVWDWCGVIASKKGFPVLLDGERMPGAKWFPEARLNFAQNLLRRGDRGDALVFWDETGFRRRLSYSDLTSEVSRAAQALQQLGLRAGDRAAAFIPNIPETAMCALAVLSQGMVWTSCSPDFGVEGVLERFGQVEPKILFCADGYRYAGREHDSLERIAEIAERLPSLRKVVVIPHLRAKPDIAAIPKAVLLEQWLRRHTPAEIEYVQLPFDHPAYILFTSGTTGVPKCIVHSAGGALLSGLKMYKLQFDVRPGDRFFYYTTCNWVMWNLLFEGLAAEAAVLLYDGSPFERGGRILFDYAAAERCTHFGTSAKFIDAIEKRDLRPAETHDLAGLRMILSTGSPLVAESYDYVYEHVKRDVCLSSISGGTDIMAAFGDANPVLPVFRGELQCRSLGMAVEVFDDHGAAVVGQKGELVCTRPFPSMPLGFWNDRGGEKYHAAYFDRYPNIWCHGDWSELTERGTLIVYGRSDATLNPGGVRIGTAEIYRQVEKIDEIEESVAIGQLWPPDKPVDTRVVLFVRLRPGYTLDEALAERIRKRIRDNTTPRHVPARILQVPDIPRTKNNKVVELAVKAVVHGMPVANTDALANPEALELFRNLPELAA